MRKNFEKNYLFDPEAVLFTFLDLPVFRSLSTKSHFNIFPAWATDKTLIMI